MTFICRFMAEQNSSNEGSDHLCSNKPQIYDGLFLCPSVSVTAWEKVRGPLDIAIIADVPQHATTVVLTHVPVHEY